MIFFVKSVQGIMHYNNIKSSPKKKAQKAMVYRIIFSSTSQLQPPSNPPTIFFIISCPMDMGFPCPHATTSPPPPTPTSHQTTLPASVTTISLFPLSKPTRRSFLSKLRFLRLSRGVPNAGQCKRFQWR